MNHADDNNDSMPTIHRPPVPAKIVASDTNLPDLELLQMFVKARDQQAMATIIARHGPLVMGVCRRILKNEHDVADAFQATFLVLLKKAESLGESMSVAGWLYGVAHRVAMKSRSQSAGRKKREGTGMTIDPTAPAFVPVDEDTVRLIHEELFKLPERFRLLLIMCCLEGAEREAAAEQLGWSLGSLKGRLERGREMLQLRLKRRGVVLSVAVLTGALTQQALAEVPIALVSSTVSSLALIAAGQTVVGDTVSANTFALTQGVLKAMTVAKMKTSVVAVLIGIFAATGSAIVAYRVYTGLAAARQPKTSQTVELSTQVAQSLSATATISPNATDEERKSLEHEKLRRQSLDNGRTLGLAMHNYEAKHGSFPPAAHCDPDGKPLLSWRVLLLPHLDDEELFLKFRLNEPWDSPHNKPLLARMPTLFSAPGLEQQYPNQTFYQVFTGEGTMFNGPKGMKKDKVTDGLGWTIMVVEAGTPAPWTAPVDVVCDADKPLPKLGGIFSEGFYTVFGDGSARFVPREISDTQLRPYITPAAGDATSPF